MSLYKLQKLKPLTPGSHHSARVVSVSESMMGRQPAACFGGSDYFCQLVLPQRCYTCLVTCSFKNLKLARAGNFMAAVQLCFLMKLLKLLVTEGMGVE